MSKTVSHLGAVTQFLTLNLHPERNTKKVEELCIYYRKTVLRNTASNLPSPRALRNIGTAPYVLLLHQH